MTRSLSNPKEAYQLLIDLGASKRLLTHAQLVSETTQEILKLLENYPLKLNSSVIYIGAMIHDAGKIVHTSELTRPGSYHEAAGEALLLQEGVDAHIARFCMSHAQFDEIDCSLEELVVALADKLWRGKRVGSLELKIIDRVAESIGENRWSIFMELDQNFEKIASKGLQRLERST